MDPKSEFRLPPSYYPIRLAIEDENLFRSQQKKVDDIVGDKRSTSSSKNEKPINRSSAPPKEIINLDDEEDVIIIDRSNLLSNPLENGVSECVIKEKCQRYSLAWQYSSMKFRPYRPILDAMSDHWDKKPSEIDALIGNMVSKLPIPINRKPSSTVNVQNLKSKRTNVRRTIVRDPKIQRSKKRPTKKITLNNSTESNDQEINKNLNEGKNVEQSIVVEQNTLLGQDENIQPIIENTQPIIENTQPIIANPQPIIENNASFDQNLGNDKRSVNLDLLFNNDQNIQQTQQNTSNACSNFQANPDTTSAMNQSGEKSSFDQNVPQSNPNLGNQQNDGNSMANILEPKQQSQQELVPQTVGNISDKDINNNDISYTSCADCSSSTICTNCSSHMFSEFPWDILNHNEQVSMPDQVSKPETNNDNKMMDKSNDRMLPMDFWTPGPIDFSEISFLGRQDEEMEDHFDFEQDLWNSYNLL